MANTARPSRFQRYRRAHVDDSEFVYHPARGRELGGVYDDDSIHSWIHHNLRQKPSQSHTYSKKQDTVTHDPTLPKYSAALRRGYTGTHAPSHSRSKYFPDLAEYLHRAPPATQPGFQVRTSRFRGGGTSVASYSSASSAASDAGIEAGDWWRARDLEPTDSRPVNPLSWRKEYYEPAVSVAADQARREWNSAIEEPTISTSLPFLHNDDYTTKLTNAAKYQKQNGVQADWLDREKGMYARLKLLEDQFSALQERVHFVPSHSARDVRRARSSRAPSVHTLDEWDSDGNSTESDTNLVPPCARCCAPSVKASAYEAVERFEDALVQLQKELLRLRIQR